MSNEIVNKNKIGMKGFAGKVAKARSESPMSEYVTAKNRIALMLDNSGSMSSPDQHGQKRKIDLLKDAVEGFVNACDFKDTALCLYAIPTEEKSTVHMTQQGALIIIGSLGLDAMGSTPLGSTMQSVIDNESITRALIVSDGEANANVAIQQAKQYRDAEIPCDCLHIGSTSAGEQLLTEIAKITGGVFIKFKDVNQFAKAMHFLSPRYAALLGGASESEIAQLLGVSKDEVRR